MTSVIGCPGGHGSVPLATENWGAQRGLCAVSKNISHPATERGGTGGCGKARHFGITRVLGDRNGGGY